MQAGTWTTVMLTEYGLTRGQSITVTRVAMATGARQELHSHGEHQLALAESGACTVRVGDEGWAVQAGQAVWIPAAHEHDIAVTSDLDLVCVYLDPDECRPPGERAHAFTAGGLLRQLVARLARPDLDDDQACRLRAVLVDALAMPGVTKTSLPVPRHPGARTVARALLAAPADPRHLSDWSAEVFVSERTLQRAFVAGTGLTFAAWRAMVRLEAAGSLLDSGHPVSAVAAMVGYESTNGFVSAYRRHFGRTPARHALSA